MTLLELINITNLYKQKNHLFFEIISCTPCLFNVVCTLKRQGAPLMYLQVFGCTGNRRVFRWKISLLRSQSADFKCAQENTARNGYSREFTFLKV